MSIGAAAPSLHVLPQRRRRERVVYSLLLFVAVFLFIDPFYFGIGMFRVNRDIGPLKYVLALLASSSLLYDGLVLSRKSHAQQLLFSRGVMAGFGVLIFGAMVLMGSIYAKIGQGISENFLQLAIGCLLGFLTGLISICAADRPDELLRRFFKFLTFGLVYALPMIAWKRVQGGQAFHTEIFLVLPVLAYWYMNLESRLRRTVVALLMLATAVCLHKNIGYFTLAICVYAIIASRTAPGAATGGGHAARYKMLYVCGALLLLLVAVAIRLKGGDVKIVPSGSVEVRSFVYHQMWRRFLESPLIGDFYSSSALVDLPYLQVLGSHHVTAHSDWLDAMAHGGLLALLLLSCATLLLLRTGPAPHSKAATLEMTRQRKATIAALWAICAAGTVVSAFVSMLSALPIAFLFWTAMGFYVGIKNRN